VQGRSHAETIFRKADKGVFNLHAINLTAIGTALPNRRLESNQVQAQVQEIQVQFKLIPKHNF